MSYRGIIVEDDRIVRSYMMGLDVWENYDIEIIDGARDGVEALEKINQLKPDLVVTDISMPQMNGVELIREIRAFDRFVYIMVLSCHDEFEYVKEAMKLGADEYILKNTFNEKELAATLADTVQTMAEKQGQSGQLSYDKQDLKFYFFNQTIAGSLTGEEREKRRQEAGIIGAYVNSAVISFCITQWSKVKSETLLPELERYSRHLLQRLGEHINRYLNERSDYIEIIYLGEGNYCCFVDLSEERRVSQMQQQLIETVSVIHKCLQKEPYDYVIGVSDVCTGEANVKQATFQARKMVKLSFYQEDPVLYHAGGLGNNITERLPETAAELLRQLPGYLNEDGGEVVNERLREVLMMFREELTAPGVVIKWLKDLDHLLQIERDFEWYSHIYRIADVERSCNEYEEKLLLHSRRQIPDGVSPPMRSALEYIHKHYKEKIGLKEVAEAVHLNAAYLSGLFNREMPVGFPKYILNLRMETAVKLLRNTNYKVKEVAGKAGFYDYHYFARAFKSIQGCSPLEYRKQYL